MGKGGDTTTNSVSKFEPPSWAAQYFPEYMARAYDISNKYGTDPSLVYGNNGQPMVAQMSQLQNQAANGYNALGSAVPWQQQQQTQLNANDALNGFMYNGGQNQYAGDNPYLQNVLNASNQDITNQYKSGTAAGEASAAARAGAMGGSKDTELQTANNKTLADSLAQNESNVRMGNYNQSAQLQENAFGRGMQALGMNNQTNQTQLQSLAGVMGAGDLQRQVQNDNIAAAKDLFNRNVQLPLQALDIFGNALGSASGQGSRSVSSSIPGASPYATAGGMASMLYGLLGNGGGGA
jgi:hypothetical protein